MEKVSFSLFIVLLFTTIIIHKNWNVLNAHLDTLSSGEAACQLVLNFLERASIQHIWQKYQRTFSSQQMLFHYLSFDKHFSPFSKQDKSRVFSHIRVYWNSEFCLGIWNTCQRLIPWWNLSKFFVLKHLSIGGMLGIKNLLLFFIHYLHIKRSVLLKCFSRTRGQWSMWKNWSGNTEENDGNTLLKFHRDSPPLAKALRWNLPKFVVIKHF